MTMTNSSLYLLRLKKRVASSQNTLGTKEYVYSPVYRESPGQPTPEHRLQGWWFVYDALTLSCESDTWASAPVPGVLRSMFSCLESHLPREAGEFHEQQRPLVPGIITPAVVFPCVPGSLTRKGTVSGLGPQKHRWPHRSLVWPWMLGTDWPPPVWEEEEAHGNRIPHHTKLYRC